MHVLFFNYEGKNKVFSDYEGKDEILSDFVDASEEFGYKNPNPNPTEELLSDVRN